MRTIDLTYSGGVLSSEVSSVGSTADTGVRFALSGYPSGTVRVCFGVIGAEPATFGAVESGKRYATPSPYILLYADSGSLPVYLETEDADGNVTASNEISFSVTPLGSSDSIGETVTEVVRTAIQWSEDLEYSKGDICTYNARLYVATRTTSTRPDLDGSGWDAYSGTDTVESLISASVSSAIASLKTLSDTADSNLSTALDTHKGTKADASTYGHVRKVTSIVSGSKDVPTAGAVYTAIEAVKTLVNTKQSALTFDSHPTEGSSNPVTSGGVKTALDAVLSAAGSVASEKAQSQIDHLNGKIQNNSDNIGSAFHRIEDTERWNTLQDQRIEELNRLIGQMDTKNVDEAEGIAKWNSDTVYNSGAFVHLGSKLYYSLVSDNKGHNPSKSTSSEYWVLYAGSGASTSTLIPSVSAGDSVKVFTLPKDTTSKTFTHSFGTSSVVVYVTASGKLVYPYIKVEDSESVTVNLGAPASEDMTVTIFAPLVLESTVDSLSSEVSKLTDQDTGKYSWKMNLKLGNTSTAIAGWYQIYAIAEDFFSVVATADRGYPDNGDVGIFTWMRTEIKSVAKSKLSWLCNSKAAETEDVSTGIPYSMLRTTDEDEVMDIRTGTVYRRKDGGKLHVLWGYIPEKRAMEVRPSMPPRYVRSGDSKYPSGSYLTLAGGWEDGTEVSAQLVMEKITYSVNADTGVKTYIASMSDNGEVVYTKDSSEGSRYVSGQIIVLDQNPGESSYSRVMCDRGGTWALDSESVYASVWEGAKEIKDEAVYECRTNRFDVLQRFPGGIHMGSVKNEGNRISKSAAVFGDVTVTPVAVNGSSSGSGKLTSESLKVNGSSSLGTASAASMSTTSLTVDGKSTLGTSTKPIRLENGKFVECEEYGVVGSTVAVTGTKHTRIATCDAESSHIRIKIMKDGRQGVLEIYGKRLDSEFVDRPRARWIEPLPNIAYDDVGLAVTAHGLAADGSHPVGPTCFYHDSKNNEDVYASITNLPGRPQVTEVHSDLYLKGGLSYAIVSSTGWTAVTDSVQYTLNTVGKTVTAGDESPTSRYVVDYLTDGPYGIDESIGDKADLDGNGLTDNNDFFEYFRIRIANVHPGSGTGMSKTGTSDVFSPGKIRVDYTITSGCTSRRDGTSGGRIDLVRGYMMHTETDTPSHNCKAGVLSWFNESYADPLSRSEYRPVIHVTKTDAYMALYLGVRNKTNRSVRIDSIMIDGVMVDREEYCNYVQVRTHRGVIAKGSEEITTDLTPSVTKGSKYYLLPVTYDLTTLREGKYPTQKMYPATYNSDSKTVTSVGEEETNTVSAINTSAGLKYYIVDGNRRPWLELKAITAVPSYVHNGDTYALYGSTIVRAYTRLVFIDDALNSTFTDDSANDGPPPSYSVYGFLMADIPSRPNNVVVLDEDCRIPSDQLPTIPSSKIAEVPVSALPDIPASKLPQRSQVVAVASGSKGIIAIDDGKEAVAVYLQTTNADTGAVTETPVYACCMYANKKLYIKGLTTDATYRVVYLTADGTGHGSTATSGGMTSAEVDALVTAKGYQTASQVQTAIASSGHQTASDVSTAVTGAVSDLKEWSADVPVRDPNKKDGLTGKNNFVHVIGEETVAGVKTFTDTVHLTQTSIGCIPLLANLSSITAFNTYRLAKLEGWDEDVSRLSVMLRLSVTAFKCNRTGVSFDTGFKGTLPTDGFPGMVLFDCAFCAHTQTNPSATSVTQWECQCSNDGLTAYAGEYYKNGNKDGKETPSAYGYGGLFGFVWDSTDSAFYLVCRMRGYSDLMVKVDAIHTEEVYTGHLQPAVTLVPEYDASGKRTPLLDLTDTSRYTFKGLGVL